MKLSEWRSLWRFGRMINIPELSITLMCPYFFVRLMWYTTSKEFRGWPNTLDSGLVIGWRWPFAKRFKEKQWLKKIDMPLAIYGAMDETYHIRAIKNLGWVKPDAIIPTTIGMNTVRYIAPTIRKIMQSEPKCGHNYWIADCQMCAKKALTLAIQLMEKQEPHSAPDPNESPLAAFQRREAEAKKRLGVGQ